MVMHVALNHRTTYRYDRLVGLAPQLVRLRPAPHCRTHIVSYSLKIEPEHHFLNWQQDPFGNYLARLVFPERTRELKVEVDLVAEMAALNPFDFFVEPSAETFPFEYEPALKKDLAPYLECERPGEYLAAWMKSVTREPTPIVDFLVGLNQRLQGDIGYVIRMEPGIQTCEETLGLRSGSCRDSAWLLVQILRNLGLAARFVSGYLIQLKPDQKSLDGPSGTEQDFTDLHAWTEVYLPGAGWVGFDPTSGLLADEGHIPLACTPDPQTAAPISGAVDPCEVEFGFEMSVRRFNEQPRVTKPYPEEQWQEILAAGHLIDEHLERGDVRLTVGGEPTFVSIDDREGAEWNTAAVGPYKRGRADDLIKRLQARFAPNGMLHYGQGKWYPGEQLPRWAFALYWRGDGLPLWRNPALVADETKPGNATIEHVERFMLGLTERLGVDPDNALPAFEDPAYFVLKEHMLPENLDPLDSKLDDPMERTRLARVFDRGLDQPVGFALPIQRWQARDGRRWRSERWATRRGRLFLTPGNSPAGYRLPLNALPWIETAEYPHVISMDPFAAHAALPAQAPQFQNRRTTPNVPPPGAVFGSGISGAVRTAIAVEAREGRVCVFMPPTDSAEEYTELVAAIEDTAAALSMQIQLEGYAPPPDARLNVIKVTPDPGVIEVNIQPSHSWAEQVAITEAVYEEARLARLDTCKFMIDGRQVGTGGGNHVVVGGATPADSPFLRRPDLLASLVTYWQNHPSLSYLFSGLFIGPTSQAPRLDEARDDQLYELEIALKQIPDPGLGYTPPWLVDRIFRNILIDVTGNTHRAEICIDKLYSPDGPTGRLGLVEFRAFEMPPHARMSLAQQLVLRALIAWFWDEPYRQPLIRFGTDLHDRYMLPHYVWRDFENICSDLQLRGLPIKSEWFQTHFEFRFPYYGHVTYRDVTLELRAALEPWHVMGEEGAIGGTIRYVDSSLERLQVKAMNLEGDRFAIACNGRAMPLQPTGEQGTRVAGVRFRAWHPPSCLHPTIGVHSPLRFDLVDRWNGRSVGGCTYHVMHPAGRNYEFFPVNDLEAEGRRLARFEPFGHTPGPMQVQPADPHPEFPHTLDLRRFS
ncbi:MAG: transglutaminase family protein [Geminicoccaceae bacterium]